MHSRPLCLGAKRPSSGCFRLSPAAFIVLGKRPVHFNPGTNVHGFSGVWAQRAQTFDALRNAQKHFSIVRVQRTRDCSVLALASTFLVVNQTIHDVFCKFGDKSPNC